MHQMNPVKRFGAKVSERNGDWTKMWQRHLENKTQRQTDAGGSKVEQGLSTALKEQCFQADTFMFSKMGDQEIGLKRGRLKRPQETKTLVVAPEGGAVPAAVRHARAQRKAEPATTSDHAFGA